MGSSKYLGIIIFYIFRMYSSINFRVLEVICFFLDFLGVDSGSLQFLFFEYRNFIQVKVFVLEVFGMGVGVIGNKIDFVVDYS